MKSTPEESAQSTKYTAGSEYEINEQRKKNIIIRIEEIILKGSQLNYMLRNVIG